VAGVNYNHGTTEYRGIFLGTYRGAKSVVPRNTNGQETTARKINKF